KTRRWLLLFSAVAFLILTPFILLYTAGYRLTDDWQFRKTGGIYIHSPISGSEIFLNDALQKTTNLLQTGVFIQNLRPAKYNALVAKEDHWPWQKELTVRSELVTEANAFLIPRSPDGRVILRGNFLSLYGSPKNEVLMIEESSNGKKRLVFYQPSGDKFLTVNSTSTAKILANYNDLKNIYSESGAIYVENNAGKIIQTTFDLGKNLTSAKYIAQLPDTLLTDKNAPEVPAQLVKYDARERLRVYAQGNVIFAEWLPTDLPLPYFLQSKKERIVSARLAIRALDLYPNRRDLVIYAAETGVYVTELDGRGGRNTQPLYKGAAPTFTLLSGDNKIYVLDGDALMEIGLP
ncbi:MAG: hypothetical protein HZA25_01920, partial [Candidatus Niyogibacteria bacterium]|nr:hypothetical protein [Candidatus Niyogibacteria bacterium]